LREIVTGFPPALFHQAESRPVLVALTGGAWRPRADLEVRPTTRRRHCGYSWFGLRILRAGFGFADFSRVAGVALLFYDRIA